jgi:radical SAM protein with 4Fe4S-binding SPASM domain
MDLPGFTPLPRQLAYAMQCVDDQISLGHKAKFGVCIPHCFYPSSSLGCIAGVAACTIDSFGNMRPCNHSPTVVGNLLYKDLHQLWDSREMKSWRRSPDNCRGCSSIATCRGGCRAQAQLSGKEMDPLAGSVLMPAHPDWLGNTSILEEV